MAVFTFCPICQQNPKDGPFTLVPWQASVNHTRFGLGTANKRGEVCCSLNEGEYTSFEEAKEAAQNTSIEELYADFGYPQDDYEDQSYGDYEMFGPDYPSYGLRF